jgi:hypothetical protein
MKLMGQPVFSENGIRNPEIAQNLRVMCFVVEVVFGEGRKGVPTPTVFGVAQSPDRRTSGH